MAEAIEIHGAAFKGGSAILLARIVDAAGSPLVAADIRRAEYTVRRLDPNDPDGGSPIEGHEAVAVPVATLIGALRCDGLWDLDTAGYNFKHVLDVSAHAAFPQAGRCYRVEFRLAPVAGQVIVVRFRIHVL